MLHVAFIFENFPEHNPALLCSVFSLSNKMEIPPVSKMEEPSHLLPALLPKLSRDLSCQDVLTLFACLVPKEWI